ncbi:hypothetical protein Dimus_003521 [Dionaea muscipula]
MANVSLVDRRAYRHETKGLEGRVDWSRPKSEPAWGVIDPELGLMHGEAALPELGRMHGDAALPELGRMHGDAALPELDHVHGEEALPELGHVHGEEDLPELGHVHGEEAPPSSGDTVRGGDDVGSLRKELGSMGARPYGSSSSSSPRSASS